MVCVLIDHTGHWDMKRWIISLLTFIISLSFVSTALSASSDSKISQVEYVADVLSGLGIYDNTGSVSETMSRMEFIRELSSVIDKDNVFTYSEDDVKYISDVSKADKRYVALAIQKGIVKKPTDGRFYPNNNVDLDFAAYAFVALAGYVVDIQAESYVSRASELGIIKGISAGSGITKGDFLIMLYNYTGAKYLVQTGYGSGAKYEMSDKTVLEGVFNIEKFDARLVSSSYSDMTETGDLSDGYIALQRLKNGVIEQYKCEYNFDSELMGRNVTVFYDTDEEVVRYMILKTGDNYILDIKGSEFVSFDLDSRKLYYNTMISGSRWEQSFREKSISVPINVDIIYNGQFTLDHDFVYGVLIGKENLNVGRICLFDIDNDSKADLMSIDAYTNVVVNSVNTDRETLSDRVTGNIIELHTTDNDYISSITDTQGNEMMLSDIKKNDVVSVYVGKGSHVMIKAVVCRLEEVDSAISMNNKENSITTENRKYYLSHELANNASGFSLGQEYRFLLDAMGRIAEVIEDNSIYNNIGSVIKVRSSETYDGYDIDIFTANGDFVTYKTSEKLRVGDSRVNQSEEEDWTFVDEKGNTVRFLTEIKKGIIQFEIDNKNEIRRIYLPKKKAGKGELAFSSGIADPEDVFLVPENHILRYKVSGRYFIPASSITANNFVVMKNDTKIITVPADSITSGREDFCSVNQSIKNDAELSVVGFTLTPGAIRSDLLVIVNSGSVSIDNSPYYVVTEKYISRNLDGCAAMALECMDARGSILEFVGNAEKIPECDTQTGTIMNNEVSISVGDVIKVALDNFGEMRAIGKAYDYVTKTGISINPSYWYASKRFVAASVYDIDEDAVSYILGDTIDGSTDISANIQMAGLGRTKAIIVKPNGTRTDVTYGNISDAIGYKDSPIDYSRLVLSGGYGETSFVVFYLQEE